MTDTKVNLAAVLYGKQDLRLEDRSVPVPNNEEVLVKITSCGLGGADIYRFLNGRIGESLVESPTILGHEAAGVVVQTGAKVKTLVIGDRVAIERPQACRICDYCKSGRYNLCDRVSLGTLATQPGTMCRYICHLADLCHKLPEQVSTDEGALVELAAIAVQACRRVNVMMGNFVLVCGAGPVGLAVVQVARAMGASKIVVTDMLESRLEKAKQMGANFTYKITKETEVIDATAHIQNLLAGMPDRTIDSTGAEFSIRLAIMVNKSGGAIGMLGLGASEIRVPLTKAARRQIDVRGIWRYANCFPAAIELIASGQVSLKDLVTERFELENILEAMEMARTSDGTSIKIMIDC